MSARNKTAHEVADALGVARTSVYEWMRCGCPHDVTPSPGARGGQTYTLDIEEVQQWRATRVHGNTNVVRAPKPDPVEPSSREAAQSRLTAILEQYQRMPVSTRTHLRDLIDELIDTQEAIAKQALNQIATAKRAANELVANRSKPQ